MDSGASDFNKRDKREGALSPTEPTHPTMRQSGTFEAFGNAEQRLYVRSGSRLATEIQSDFGTATCVSRVLFPHSTHTQVTRNGSLKGFFLLGVRVRATKQVEQQPHPKFNATPLQVQLRKPKKQQLYMYLQL